MKRTLINSLIFDQPIRVAGFVDAFRNKGRMAFIVLRDISGKLQVTIEKERHPDLIAVLDTISTESVVEVIGKVVHSDYVKLNNCEMIPESIKLLSTAAVPPIDATSFLDLRMDYRWLDLRQEKNTLIFKVQTLMVNVMREFLVKEGFLEIHSPKIIGAASESGADVFALDYFDRKAYLAQSPQFYKQMAMAAGFEKVFEVGPCFRAEKSNTSKHTTEFTSFDVEISYIDSYRDVIDLEARMLTCALAAVKERYGEEIARHYGIEVVVPTLPFPSMRLDDIYAELKERYGYQVAPHEYGDLTSEAEKLVHRLAQDKFNHEFMFVTDYHHDKRAFYHMRDGQYALGYDLVWRGVEITTGAQREHRHEVLKEIIAQKGLGEDVHFYLEFFHYGCPPHGGFAVGVDRLTMLLLGIGIKEAMYLFRGTTRLNP